MGRRRDEEDEKSARRRSEADADETDVEGHRRHFVTRADGEGAEKSEDEKSDDVEGHMRRKS
jgi:hypothetical protein